MLGDTVSAVYSRGAEPPTRAWRSEGGAGGLGQRAGGGAWKVRGTSEGRSRGVFCPSQGEVQVTVFV